MCLRNPKNARIIRKNFIKSALVFFIACALLELTLAYVEFHKLVGEDRPVLVSMLKDWVSEVVSRPNDSSVGVARGDIDEKLCSPGGGALLKKITDEYTEEFAKLIFSVKKMGAHFILLYLPIHNVSGSECKQFFYDLQLMFQVDFVDLSRPFSAYAPEQIYLLPEDIHLSRFAHQIIAKTLLPHLQLLSEQRSGMTIDSKRARGGLPANLNRVRVEQSNRPYRLVTNAQGFRMNQVPNNFSQRILVLGDSFTFGPYLSNSDTYCGILNSSLRNQSVINAGISGYSIEDERELFESHAKYVGPDIVILQVSDNDLSDLFWLIRKNKAKSGEENKSLKLEKDFIESFKPQ